MLPQSTLRLRLGKGSKKAGPSVYWRVLPSACRKTCWCNQARGVFWFANLLPEPSLCTACNAYCASPSHRRTHAQSSLFADGLFRIPFCLFGNCLFGLLFQIGICFDVGSVHKNSFCVQIPFLCRSFQYPAEHILHRGVVEPALEVIAHCGEMRHCFVQRISYEPPVCQIHIHFFQRSPKGRNSIDMLDQHDLEQHHRVNAWPAIVLKKATFR